MYSLCFLLSVQPILFAVRPAYPVWSLKNKSCLLSVHPFIFAVCTAYPVCCLYNLSYLLYVIPMLFCCLFVQPILFAVCTTNLHQSYFLSIHTIIFALCTDYLVCFLCCLSYLMLVHPIPFAVCKTSLVYCMYSLSSLLSVVVVCSLYLVCTKNLVGCLYCLYSLHMCVQPIQFAVRTACLVCCLYNLSCLLTVHSLSGFWCPYRSIRLLYIYVQPILFSVRKANPIFTVFFCLYSLTSCLLSEKPTPFAAHECTLYSLSCFLVV